MISTEQASSYFCPGHGSDANRGELIKDGGQCRTLVNGSVMGDNIQWDGQLQTLFTSICMTVNPFYLGCARSFDEESCIDWRWVVVPFQVENTGQGKTRRALELE